MSIAPNTTLRALLDVSAAINLLEGTQTVVKDESGTDRAVTVPYKFSGKTRWNLMKNISWTKRVSEHFIKTRDRLIQDISGGTGRIEADDELKIKEFNDKITEFLETEQSTSGLLPLSLDGLNLDANQIPLAVLSALEPIISE